MAAAFDIGTPAKRFRFIAIAEALTWAALLVSMAIKWIPEPNIDSAVRVPGMLHGAVFVVYLLIAVLTARSLKWSPRVTLIALAASIPPFGSVFFERRAAKTGRLAELSLGITDSATSARVSPPA